jgi:hypothetical protein
VGTGGVVRAHLLVTTEESMDKEQLFLGLGADAKWSDPSHLTVELKGHKESFQTPYKDKNAVLTENDGKNVRDFLESAGIGKDMAKG